MEGEWRTENDKEWREEKERILEFVLSLEEFACLIFFYQLPKYSEFLIPKFLTLFLRL